jgi:hypothetical protein
MRAHSSWAIRYTEWQKVRLRCKWWIVRPAEGWDFEKIDKRWVRNVDDLSHGTATCWTWFKTNYVTNVGVPKRYCISNKLTKSDPHWHLAVQVAPTNSGFSSCHISSVIYEICTLTNGCDQLYNLSKNLNEVILPEFLCMWEVLHQLCQAQAQFKFWGKYPGRGQMNNNDFAKNNTKLHYGTVKAGT